MDKATICYGRQAYVEASSRDVTAIAGDVVQHDRCAVLIGTTTVGMDILIGHVRPTLEDAESATQTIADLKYTGPAGPQDEPPQQKKN